MVHCIYVVLNLHCSLYYIYNEDDNDDDAYYGGGDAKLV